MHARCVALPEDQQQLGSGSDRYGIEVLDGLIDKFRSDVSEAGAVLKITQLEDV